MKGEFSAVKQKDEQYSKLIECVRDNPLLYDKKDKLYMDNIHKSSVWATIAVACKFKSTSICLDVLF